MAGKLSWRSMPSARLEQEVAYGEALLQRAADFNQSGWPQDPEDFFREVFDWCESIAFSIWLATDGRSSAELESLGWAPLDTSLENRTWYTSPVTVISDITAHLRLGRKIREALVSEVEIGAQTVHESFLLHLLGKAEGVTSDSALRFLANVSCFELTSLSPDNALLSLQNIGAIEQLSDGRVRLTSDGRQYLDRLDGVSRMLPPTEIEHSYRDFRADHPSQYHVAFIVMRFGRTTAHEKITSSIRETLKPFGIAAVRADDREYHDSLFHNILTYMYGCGFCIAVFDQIEALDFNPNVALEVGYMMAMKKPVCLLKDRHLKALPSDLIGKLYRTFDSYDPGGTIPPALSGWLREKRIV